VRRRKGHKQLAFCILPLIFALNAAAAPKPEMTIDISKARLIPGEVFELKVHVKNDGTTAERGGITVSFPDAFAFDAIEGINSDAETHGEFAKIYALGSEIYSVQALNNKIRAQHVMAEAWYGTRWKTGKTHWLSLKIRPDPERETCKMYIRASLRKPGTRVDALAPSSSDTSDQQGFPVTVKTVEVGIPTEIYTVGLYNRYSTFDAEEATFQSIGREIDQQVKEKIEAFYPGLIQVQVSGSFSASKPLGQLTKTDLEPLNAEIAFCGEIRRTQNGIDLRLRVYSEVGAYLSEVISTETKIIDELPAQYVRLILGNLPLRGWVASRKGNQIEILFNRGVAKANLLSPERYLWRLTDSEANFELKNIRIQPNAAKLTGVLAFVPESIIIEVGSQAISLASMKPVTPIVLQILDRRGNRLPNCQVYVSLTEFGKGEYAGLTDHDGKIRLSPAVPIFYVSVKRQNQLIGRFEVFSSKGTEQFERLNVESSEFR
jgi:hypothetical protein